MKRKINQSARLLLFILFLVGAVLILTPEQARADTKVPLNSLPPGTVIHLGPYTQNTPYYSFDGYNWIVLDPNTGYVLMQQNLEGYFGGWWHGFLFEWNQRFDVSFAPDNQNNIAYKLNHDFLNGGNGLEAFSPGDQAAILTHDWTTADEKGQTHGYPPTVNCKIGLISRDEYIYYTNNQTFLGIINPQTFYFTRTPSSTGYAETWNVQGDKLTTPDLGYNPTNNAFVRPAMYLNPNTPVTVVPGYGETGKSTVLSSLPAVTSNGIATSTITVTLRDCQGALLKNRTVALTADSGRSVITPISAVTDNNGVAVFTVKDNTAETVTYTATDTTCPPNIRITRTVAVTFLPADAGLSKVLPASSSITAGSSQTITVTLVDAGNNPMPNKQVSLNSSSENSIINGQQWSARVTTDNNGTASFTVNDKIAETVTFIGLDMSDNLILTQTASVTFTPGEASQLAWHTQPSESGTAGAAFGIQPVVYLVDQYGNLVTSDSSTTITLTASGGEPLAGNIMKFASGAASFSNLMTTKAGTFTLTASGGGFSSAPSSEVTISPAEVKKLLWQTQPPTNGTQGTALGIKPVVYLYDQYDNMATNDSSTKVALSTSDWRVLGGIVGAKAINGVVTFDPVPESTGTFTLKAVAYPQIESVPSIEITVSPSAPQLYTLKAGTVVNFAGYNWIVLDPSNGYLLMQNNLSTYHGITSDSLYLPFDTNSGIRVFDPDSQTSIAYYLNNTFYNSLPSACRSSIAAFQRWGIGPNDGQGNNNEETSFTTCKIGLISYSEYKKYQPIIDAAPGGVSEYWWTRTPRFSDSAWFVFYSSPGSYYASSGETVRPTLYLDPLLPLDGNIVGFPVPNVSIYDVAPVPVTGGGPTSATITPNNNGDTIAIRVSGGRITPPSFGDPAPNSSDVIMPYVSGSSFNASDGDYVGFYEINNGGQVVAFSQVRVNVGATEVRVKMSTNISVGGYDQLTATLHLMSSGQIPAPYATWSSDNRSVATVSSTGLVTGISEGTATITVHTIDNLTTTCQVIVGPAPTNPTTVSTYWPDVSVRNDPVIVNVPSNVTNASLSTTPAVSGGSAAVMLPQVTANAATAYGNVNLSIPNETQVTGPSSWNGTINLPRIVDAPGIVPYGSRAIEIGAGSDTLILSQPVRILLAGQARNTSFVGWIKNNVFTYIPYIGSDPSYDIPAAAVGVPGDGYLILGDDIVIWTKHFTTFVTYAEDDHEEISSVTSTITGRLTDGTTGNQVSNITAAVTAYSNGYNTVSVNAAQVVALKQPDGNICRLTDISKIAITTAAGSQVTIAADGTIQVPSLANGTDNYLNIAYDLGSGQKIIIETMEIKISSNGEVSLAVSLIDPYGKITDKITGKVIDGVNVSLYYANTDRNKEAGKVPDIIVSLPGIDGFKPNNNKNPQVSDISGAYGFMVFPYTDYYIVAEKVGYFRYTSPTISVEKEIVKWDFNMRTTQVPKPPLITSPVSGMTSDKTLKVTGTGEAGDIVTIYDNGVSIGTTVVDQAGNWGFMLGVPLKDGIYTISAKQTNKADNTSDSYGTVNLTVDTKAPNIPVITSPTSGITNINIPDIGGTGEAGCTVTVYDNVKSIGTSVVDKDGKWSFKFKNALADGLHQISVNQTDGAGNASSLSKMFSLTIDTQVPGVPNIVSPAEGTIRSNSVVIRGTGEVGDTVTVYDNGTLIGTVVVGQDGTWSFTPQISLSDGLHQISVKQTDRAGNNSDSSYTVKLIILTGMERISGQDRIDTSLEIAKASFTGNVSNVILTTSENYPDALAGSVLAYKLNAPILLIGDTDMDQEKVLSYMKGNMDREGVVYVLGGYGAVSGEMEDKVKEAGFSNIKRLSGADRYETAVRIAEAEGVKEGTPVVIVSGENYPDALSISSTAAVRQYPILLVAKDGIPDCVREELSKIKPEKVYIIGLQGVISEAVEDEISKILPINKPDIVRIGGSDRFETSLKVARQFNLQGDIVCVAIGNDFPDALAGSIYAAKYNSPIILVDKDLMGVEKVYLEDKKISGVTIFGGEGVVSKDIEQQLSKLLGR